jgi:hypothetical protein
MRRFILSLSFLITGLTSVQAKAEGKSTYSAAVGIVGSPSFMLGTELWALSQILLRPAHDISIETVEVEQEADRLTLLQSGEADFAIVEGEAPTPLALDLRAVIVYAHQQTDGRRAKPLQLLAHADMPEEIVFRINGVLFDYMMRSTDHHATMAVASQNDAMNGLSLPIHPGAFRFFEDRAHRYEENAPPKTTDAELTAYDAAFQGMRLDADEVLQVSRACAAARGEAEHFADLDVDGLCSKTDQVLDGMSDVMTGGQGGPKIAVRDMAVEGRTTSFLLDAATPRLIKHRPVM